MIQLVNGTFRPLPSALTCSREARKAEGEATMRLRRRIATLLLASLSLSTSALALPTPSPAGAVLPGVIDVAVSIEAKPSVVSPPGEAALYEVQASNPGIVGASSATVTVTLPAGSFYDDAVSASACSGSGEVATCEIGALAAGSTTTFELVATTPTTVGMARATATIEENDLLIEPLEYKGNNTDIADVDVQAASGAGAFGLVRGGDSISLLIGDGRAYHLQVPASSPGVIVSIRPDDGAKSCGDTACGKGFITEFVPHPYFKAEDPTDPILTRKTFGPKEPCEGLGAPSGCYELYWAKDGFEEELAEMDPCTAPGDATPSPCLDGNPTRIQGADGKKVVWFKVNMLSNDPVERPPLLLGLN